MPLPPQSMPPQAPPRRVLRGVVAAGLITAAGVGTWAALQDPPQPRPSLQVTARASLPADDGVPDDAVAWPLAAGAVGMFHCQPAGTQPTDMAASVVVWTDAANNVVAFGAASEAVPLPALAQALRAPGAVDSGASIQVAGPGHVVLAAGRKNALHLEGIRLGCVRNWDD